MITSLWNHIHNYIVIVSLGLKLTVVVSLAIKMYLKCIFMCIVTKTLPFILFTKPMLSWSKKIMWAEKSLRYFEILSFWDFLLSYVDAKKIWRHQILGNVCCNSFVARRDGYDVTVYCVKMRLSYKVEVVINLANFPSPDINILCPLPQPSLLFRLTLHLTPRLLTASAYLSNLSHLTSNPTPLISQNFLFCFSLLIV